MRIAPTDAELATQIEQAQSQIVKLHAHLDPLCSGTPPVSSAELDNLDTDWTCWGTEWILRRKVLYKLGPLLFSVFGRADDRRLLLTASGRLWRICFPFRMMNSLRRILGLNTIRLNMPNWNADHYVALLKGAEC